MINPFSNYYQVSFQETPIDNSKNYFGITEEMMLDFDKVTEENKSFRYSNCLKLVLFKLAPSEIEYFFKYQLPQINDKLDWLRNVNGLISNINEYDTILYPHQNREHLLNILSELIEQALKDDSLSETLVPPRSKKEKLQLEISAKQFAALVQILIEEKLIKKPKSDMQMFRTLSECFLKKDGEPLSPNALKNNYLIKSGNHFGELHGKLIRSAQNAYKKKTP